MDFTFPVNSTRATNIRGGNHDINRKQPEQTTLPSIFGGASRSQSLPAIIIISFIIWLPPPLFIEIAQPAQGAILRIILCGLYVK